MNTNLHAVTDADGRPIRFFMTAGQVSDYTGAAALLGSLPKAEWLLADRGYDADWFTGALNDKGIKKTYEFRPTLRPTHCPLSWRSSVQPSAIRGLCPVC
jgi:transposase